MNPIEPAFETLALNQLKVGVAHAMSRELAALSSTAQVSMYVDDMTDSMVFQLKARVLAEQLPPQTVDHRIDFETTTPVYATWWDHWKDTYGDRWWARWWLRRPVRYVDLTVPVQRVVTVAVRPHWTFPEARINLPDNLGRPVMVALTDSRDWWRS